MNSIHENINLKNAIVAYASALDTVEACLRNGQEPFVSNKHLSQIRMYKTPIKTSSGFSMKTFWVYLIVGYMLMYYLFSGTVEFLATRPTQILAACFFVLVVLKIYSFTFSALILTIGGGRKVQKKESAKILNELLRKSL